MAEGSRILYRFFDSDDVLLYIGRTINPSRRFEKHASTKPWWNDVNRLEIEHFDTLDALKEAEREAIISEKPLYNIRMNSGFVTPAPGAPEQSPVQGLIGRWFHSWTPRDVSTSEYATIRNGMVLEWQGQVTDRDEGIYIVQLYSWWDGSPGEQRIVSPDEMRSWTFYDTHIEMQIALDCREIHEGSKVCGGAISHYFDRRHDGYGIHFLCSGCVHRYPGFRDATPIKWRDGKPVIP